MAKYQRTTDAVHQIKLESTIERALWDRRSIWIGESARAIVHTHFVGNESPIDLKFMEETGKTLGSASGRVMNNRFVYSYPVPERAKEAIQFEASLPEHGLKALSKSMTLRPRVVVSNAKWSQSKATREDVVELTAEVRGVPDGCEAKVEIWEQHEGGGKDRITQMRTLVEGGKIKLSWLFDYFDETGEIATEREASDGYRAPEYVFEVHVEGASAQSGVLEFEDFISIALLDENGEPKDSEKFSIEFADGSKKEGKLDPEGKAQLKNIPPGPYRLDFPEVDVFEADESQPPE